MQDYDPWDKRSDDEKEGIEWPVGEPITPEMEQAMYRVAADLGRGMRMICEAAMKNVVKNK